MRLLLAILLPWLQFFTIGRPIAGGYLFGFAAHADWMDSCSDLVCVWVEPIHDRQENRSCFL